MEVSGDMTMNKWNKYTKSKGRVSDMFQTRTIRSIMIHNGCTIKLCSADNTMVFTRLVFTGYEYTQEMFIDCIHYNVEADTLRNVLIIKAQGC